MNDIIISPTEYKIVETIQQFLQEVKNEKINGNTLWTAKLKQKIGALGKHLAIKLL